MPIERTQRQYYLSDGVMYCSGGMALMRGSTANVRAPSRNDLRCLKRRKPKTNMPQIIIWFVHMPTLTNIQKSGHPWKE